MPKIAKSAANHYEAIDMAWANRSPDAPTGLDAVNAVKILWRSEVGSWPFSGIKIVSGNRYTWSMGNILCINPNRYGKGWVNLVHDLSHLAHNHKNRRPNGRHPKPHSFAQAKIELRMQRLVLDRLIQ